MSGPWSGSEQLAKHAVTRATQPERPADSDSRVSMVEATDALHRAIDQHAEAIIGLEKHFDPVLIPMPNPSTADNPCPLPGGVSVVTERLLHARENVESLTRRLDAMCRRFRP